MEPGETPDPGESPTWGTSTLKVVLGSTTLDAAILYYFGWLRTNANAARIGLDPSVFGFDAEDYILRSAPAVLASVGVIVIAGALAKLVGSSTTRAIERGGRRSNVSDRSMRTVAGFAGATGEFRFMSGAATLANAAQIAEFALFAPGDRLLPLVRPDLPGGAMLGRAPARRLPAADRGVAAREGVFPDGIGAL